MDVAIAVPSVGLPILFSPAALAPGTYRAVGPDAAARVVPRSSRLRRTRHRAAFARRLPPPRDDCLHDLDGALDVGAGDVEVGDGAPAGGGGGAHAHAALDQPVVELLRRAAGARHVEEDDVRLDLGRVDGNAGDLTQAGSEQLGV